MKKLFEKFEQNKEKEFLKLLSIGEVYGTVGTSFGVKILSIEKDDNGKTIIRGDYVDKDKNESGNIGTWDGTGKCLDGVRESDLDPTGDKANE